MLMMPLLLSYVDGLLLLWVGGVYCDFVYGVDTDGVVLFDDIVVDVVVGIVNVGSCIVCVANMFVGTDVGVDVNVCLGVAGGGGCARTFMY